MNEQLINISEERLIDLLMKNDRSAFTEIYNRYWKKLFIYAFKIFEDELICEDIIQEVFLDLWIKAGKTEIRNIERYLFQSVKYKASNAISRLKFNIDHEKILKELPYNNYIELQIDEKETNEKINNAIESLPDKCREVFQLSRNENLSNKEISEKLGISVRTVEKHITNALQILRKSLGKLAFYLILINCF